MSKSVSSEMLVTKAGRIRAARVASGFKTALSAAKHLKIPYPTYVGHENGTRGVKDAELQVYAAAFGTSVSYLAFGDKNGLQRKTLPSIPLFGHINEMQSRNSKSLEFGLIEVDAPFPIAENSSVVIIPDDRFSPYYFKGEKLLVRPTSISSAHIGIRALFVIESAGTERVSLPGIVLRLENDCLDLQEMNGRVHFNAKVTWFALVIGIIGATSSEADMPAGSNSQPARTKRLNKAGAKNC